MRKLILITIMSLSILYSHAQNGFSILGKISGNHEGYKVMLRYPNPDGLKDKIIDSTYIKDGLFSFTGNIVNGQTKAVLVMSAVGKEIDPMIWERYYEIDQQDFMLENSVIRVTGPTMRAAYISGGPVQKDYLEFKKQLKPVTEKMDTLSKKMTDDYNHGKPVDKKLGAQSRALGDIKTKIELEYLRKNPDSFVSLYVITNQGGTEHSDFEQLFASLSDRIKNSAMGSEMASRFLAMKTVAVGMPAKDFTQTDRVGQAVSLSTFKGKYVLVDFWASWCGPCRDEIPHIVKAYDRYKSKNFEVIGISLDHKKEAWLKAINEDKASWVQLSDLKGTKNEVALKYGVLGIPQNFLVSPDGIILAKDLRGNALEKLLNKLIK